MKQMLALVFTLPGFAAFSQLPDGSTAPNFTLTDYYGTTHTLYDYLDADRTVILEIFAAHCPTCWAYHQTHRLRNMYEQYGPDGTDELTVLALEYDQYNDSNAFIGNHEPWVTQGNWLEGTPYPLFNVEDPDRGVFEDYNMTYYPVIYVICPDRILEQVYTWHTEAQLYEKVQACPAATSIEDAPELGNIRFDPSTRSLIIDRYELVQGLEVLDLQGRTVQQVGGISRSVIPLLELPTGIYLFRITTENGPVVRRFFLE